MANIIESTASTNGTNTPNLGPEVLVSSGLAGPSTTTGQNGDSITTDTYSREAALKDRALKRAEKREKNHGLAMDLSKAGDALLELKDYAGACANYLHATRLWPSNDETYLKLTGAYLKCELYSEATKAATRGLSFNPKSLEQRYLRGVARLEQQLLDAAKADFTTVLAHDPHHADAKSKLELTTQRIDSNSKLAQNKDTSTESAAPVAQELSAGTTEQSSESVASDLQPQLETPSLPTLAVIDFEFPKYEDDKLEIASLSDSSEANHYGNGIPCRFYNHTGCVKGQRCEFSHAPDEKSVRDDLGRNVCIYYLLDACKFGIPKCVYSHSRQNLPTDGKAWWNDEKQRVKVKSVLEMAEAKAQEFKAKKDELKQEQKEKAKKAKAAKKKSAEKEKQKATTTADPEEKVGEARTTEEAAAETGDEKATKGKKKETKKEAPRKRKMKKAENDAKKDEGGQRVANKQAENPSEGTAAPSGLTVGGASESNAEATQQGENKKASGKKRVWRKRSKKEVAADATDAVPSDAAAPAPARTNEGGKEIAGN